MAEPQRQRRIRCDDMRHENIILGLETATSICSAGLASEGRFLAEISFDLKNNHDQVLSDSISHLLRLAGLRLEQIAGIAVSAGPGSFTGLRIGFGFAKGLAFAQNKPLIAINTLRLQAAAARGHAEIYFHSRGISLNAGVLVPVLTARRGEVYTAIFAAHERLPVNKSPEQVIALSDFADFAPDFAVVCGNGLTSLREASLLDRLKNCCLVPEEQARLSGGLVARMGHVMLLKGQTAGATTLEPHYVQSFVLGAPRA